MQYILAGLFLALLLLGGYKIVLFTLLLTILVWAFMLTLLRIIAE